MEVKKRVATQAEKRQFFKDQLIGDMCAGKHMLSQFLDRLVLVHMEEEDKEALLDYLMKVREEDKAMVFHTLTSLLIKQEQVELSKDDDNENELAIELKQLDMAPDQYALQEAKHDPTVRVLFKHLSPPTKTEGGWSKASDHHPSLKAWYKVVKDYPEYVLQASRNGSNVAHAWEHDLPIDYAVMISPLGKKPVMRFVVYEPYPEVQQGFNMYITPVK